MDVEKWIENLEKAAEIRKKIEKLQSAADKLDGISPFVDISFGLGDSLPARITDADFLRDLRQIIDRRIEALLEEVEKL